MILIETIFFYISNIYEDFCGVIGNLARELIVIYNWKWKETQNQPN